MDAPDPFLSQFTRIGPAAPSGGAAPAPGAPAAAGAGGAALAITPNEDENADPNLHGDDFLKTLKPSYGYQVKAYAEGKMPMPAGFALKSPYFQKVMRDVTQYDPTFDATNFGARNALRKSYEGGGKNYQELQAIGTVAGHLENLTRAADKLDNWQNLGPLTSTANSLTQSWRELNQDPRLNDFNIAKNAVSRELTKAYQGGHITDSAVAEWQRDLNAAQTPQQLKTVIGQLNELLASKRLTLEEGYRQMMGPHALPEQFSTDNKRTRAIFEDISNWAAGGKRNPAAQQNAAPSPAPGKYIFDPASGELVKQ